MTIEQIKAEAKKRFGQDITDEQAEAILKSHGSEELSAQELEDVAGGVYYQLDVIHNGTPPGTINIYNTEELSPQELEEVTGGVNNVKITYVNHIDRNMPKRPQFEPHVITYEQIKDWHVTHERIEDWIKDWLDAHGSKELSDEELDNVAGGGGPVSSEHTRETCPECGGKNLKQTREGNFWNNMCEDCGWHEGGVDY